jgi:hypothetical protein
MTFPVKRHDLQLIYLPLFVPLMQEVPDWKLDLPIHGLSLVWQASPLQGGLYAISARQAEV